MDSVTSDSISEPKTIFLKNYTVPEFLVDTVNLDFNLFESETTVSSELTIRRNPASNTDNADLVLDGQNLKLLSIAITSADQTSILADNDYSLDEETLVVSNVPDAFTIKIVIVINPKENLALEGLYLSSNMFCTQCEAQGFRRITYFPDRPDVMALFSVTVHADKKQFPILLSNGNRITSGDEQDGRHFVSWHDPFPKPSYLFALVAGDLYCQQDVFTTASGTKVDLYLFVEHENKHKCDHALICLKQSMKWDEDTFGREYDLDNFMIVAVNDFNMGAMENKGLNVFNSSCVLASPETTTDADYYRIQGIIGHEYFHNWSGNRVTCRDWFQLSLKEGFTVFRDQQFSSDMNSAAVQRIDDVNILRNAQFSQDAGPMAHPVRPQEYIEISNFYTVTVYNKGAEVVRMIHTLLGAERFRKGSDTYFERHDGQAVTVEDFVAAMESSGDTKNTVDLKQFMNWYHQAGTPNIEFSEQYDATTREYTLTLSQSCAPTPGQNSKKEFHIPVKVALLNSDGETLNLNLTGNDGCQNVSDCVLVLREKQQKFIFNDVPEKPVLSLLRGFSAPVKISTKRGHAELAFLFAHDNDDFNRWNAGQELVLDIILSKITQHQAGEKLNLEQDYIDAFKKTLNNNALDNALKAQALGLPSESYIADQCQTADPDAIHSVRVFIRQQLALKLETDFVELYKQSKLTGEYQFNAKDMGQRSIRNICLSYLMELGKPIYHQLCYEQFEQSNNMTDVLAALSLLANFTNEFQQDSLNKFYTKWQDDALVVDKWFAIQATSRLTGTLDKVKSLMQHPAFTIKNPNKVRALIGRFCLGNVVQFHNSDGSGYQFLADQVLALDKLNPQISARLIQAFSQWRNYDESRQGIIKANLNRIISEEKLSKDVFEIVSKTLA
ncbi:MAG: aminopeptidase N [Gammaproteobacteria bacterium]